MKVPFLDLKAQYELIKEEVNNGILNVLETNSYILGPQVEKFEKDFAAFCNTKYCIALNSGTSALHSALLAHGIGPEDEVITVPNSFISTTWAIDYCGAKPVFVDINDDTFLLDYNLIEPAISHKTKVIMPVHLYGQPADMDRINKIARLNDLIVIEDAAQAHGAFYKNRKIGGLGNTTCFSFYPGKNLGAYGEGGAVVTDDLKIYEYILALRNHAQSRRYQHEFLGFNYRMDGIQGAILNVKLKYLKDWTLSRNRIAELYIKNLKNIKQIKLPYIDKSIVSAFHLYVIHTSKRDTLFNYLKEAGIDCGLHYPVPIHLQKAYSYLGHKVGDFPNTEKNASNCLSLPIYPEISDQMVDYVCKSIKIFFE